MSRLQRAALCAALLLSCAPIAASKKTKNPLAQSSALHRPPSILYAVATTCLSAPSPEVIRTLGFISEISHHGDAEISALVMCYDALSSEAPKNGRHIYHLPGDVNDKLPSSGSFSALCTSKADMGSSSCTIATGVTFENSISIEVAVPPHSIAKIFRPDPKKPATVRTSKVKLWQHFLLPDRVDAFDVLFFW